MKYILSLFFTVCILSLPLRSFTAPSPPAHDVPPQNFRAVRPGFKQGFQTLSLGTVLYAPELEKSACFLKWQPVSFFSLYAGNLSFGGLWTSFSSPAPSAGSVFKQRESGKSAFAIQMSDKGIFPLYGAVEAAFPGGRISAFAGCEKRQASSEKKQKIPENKHPEYRLQTGAVISFPFTVKKTAQDKKETLSGYWTLAWRCTYIDAPQSSSWFIERPPFKPFYSQGLIQKFMIQSQNIRFSAENGCVENPYGKPAFFVSADIFHTTGIFLYNAGFFWCSKDYLKHNGSFEKKRIHAFVNPQLRFIFPYRHLDTIRLGAQADFFYKTEWTAESGAGFRIRGALYSFNTDIELPPIEFRAENKRGGIGFKDKAPVILKTELNFFPPYADFFKRKWTIGAHCTFNTGVQNSGLIKNYGVKSGFNGVFKIKNRLRCTASVSVQADFPAASTRIKTGIDMSLPLQLSGNKIRLSTSADGECLLKKTSLQKINGGVTVKLRYN